MKHETYPVIGMHCASCASLIEKKLKKEKGVHAIEVNPGTETAKISFEESETSPHHLSETLKPLGYTLALPSAQPSAEQMGMSESEHAAHLGTSQTKQEKIKELGKYRRNLFSALPFAVVSLLAMTWDVLVEMGRVEMLSDQWQYITRVLLLLMATYVLFVVGKPYLVGLGRFLRTRRANMDSLIGLGTSVAYLYSLIATLFASQLNGVIDTEMVFFDVTIIVITFITLGKFLETRSKIKTGDAIEKLLTLQAKTALVIRDGREVEIPITEVMHGDVIVVKPGGKIPVDGLVLDGYSFVDESMISGEPVPVSKEKGATVVAGTINGTGSFTFSATKVGSETVLARIISMVQEAQSSKAPVQALADKISSVFVPIVLVIAILSLAAWLIIGYRTIGMTAAFSYGLISFVSVLIIACPCALGLATPMAIIVGVGKGAREGILIKDAATLERLHEADVIVLDKTGTITKGKPELVSLKTMQGHDESELLSLLASIEQRSEHPIGTALVKAAAEQSLPLREVTHIDAIRGKGIQGVIEGKTYIVGNVLLMHESKIDVETSLYEEDANSGKTPVFIAEKIGGKGTLLGIAMVADAIKAESQEALTALKHLKIQVVMLTGDHEGTARSIAREVNIDTVYAEVLPEDKLSIIKRYQDEGHIVAMVGDGVNDAPALAQADVGIAMATGTDVAIESAGITLLHGDLTKLVKAFRLSRATMAGIKQNLFWAFAYNVIGIPIATGIFFPAFGLLLNPIFAGLAMALSSVTVVANALRLKRKKLS